MFHRSLPPLPSLFLLIALAIFSFPAAQAATFTVTNLDDNGPGSLRQAVIDANADPGNDTIQFQSGLSGTILLGSGEITISKSSNYSLTINGPGANVLAISGNNLSRIFHIYSGKITLNGLTLKDGKSSDSGGAIYGIYVDSTLTINSCTLSDNSAPYGGGIFVNTTMTVSNSTLSGNSATYFGGGINNDQGAVTVNNSTLSGNSASYGGGIHNYQGTLIVNNTTLSGNTATTYGAGVYNNGQSFTIGNSLLVGNEIYNATVGAFSSLGHNLFGENGVSGLEGYAVPTSKDFILPGPVSTAIGPLADNGGPTKTHLPVTGSLAIDHGDNALIPVDITTDQRGSGYPRIVGGTVDIGAVEVGSSAPPATGAAVGVFRAGTWFLDANGNGAWDGCQQNGGQDLCLYNSFGQAGDMPAAGNWNGGAKSSIGVLRSGTGEWFIDHNGNHQWDGCGTDGCYSGFGAPGDLPVAGDWNGTGFAKIGVFRNGQWFLDANGNGAWDGCGVDLCLNFGQMGDWPVAGNWDGGLKAGVGVFRNGTWFLDYNGNGKWDGCNIDRCYYGSFGQTGDLPAAGDWNGDGKAKVGVFRNGTWYLDYNGNGAWDGCAVDRCYVGSFGVKGDLPVAGQW